VYDPISEADKPLPRNQLHWLTPHPATWQNYTCCPWAKSILITDHETGGLVLCPVTCKRWGCPYCAKRKIRKLAFLTNGAKPNRWARLGVDPKLYDSPKEAWEKTSPAIPELRRKLLAHAGEFEYLRVTELHQSGYPHYHLLIRSPFIPKKIFDDEWAKLTGAPYNWLAKINDSFSSFRYLVKYLTKLHKIEWTDRHVSYSKQFFREEDKEKLAFPERDVLRRSDEHPWQWLAARYPTDTVGADEQGNYHLPYSFSGLPDNITRSDVGLPPLPSDPQEVRKTQLLMGGGDWQKEDFTDQSF